MNDSAQPLASVNPGDKLLTGTVGDYPDEVLLRRAVGMARRRDERGKHPRWVGVAYVFALGSTYAAQLCRRFGYDPEEMVR